MFQMNFDEESETLHLIQYANEITTVQHKFTRFYVGVYSKERFALLWYVLGMEFSCPY